MEDNRMGQQREESHAVYSKKIRAGKRTYFFDVKPTRNNDYYLTITESKRRPQGEDLVYEKHKIFLYKEDLKRFVEAFNKTAAYIQEELLPDYDFNQSRRDFEADL